MSNTNSNPHNISTEQNLLSKVAKTYNSQHTQQRFGDLINKATAFVLSNISFIGVDFLEPSSTFESTTKSDPSTTNISKSVRVLDYACGPGTITNILAGRATEYVGMDLSPNMVSEYNERFSSNETDSKSEKLNAHAHHMNLFDPAGPPDSAKSSEFFNFDLVAVGFGFHHFENLPTVTSRLVERLAPGGVLMILDFFSHDKDEIVNDDSVNTIAHHGFTEEQIKGLFEKAGLEDNRVLAFPEEVVMGEKKAKRWPFMARGRKPMK